MTPPEAPREGSTRWIDRAASLLTDVVYVIALPILSLLLLARIHRPKVRRGLGGKIWGFPSRSGEPPAIWVHAVSVGEVLIAEPLVRSLRARWPETPVVVSVSTYTGHEVACRRFPDLTVFWSPLDAGPCVRRALRRIRPLAVLLVELEVWPNLLFCCRSRRVPVLVVNGRMTERSCRRYEVAGGLARFLFRRITGCGVQNAEYADRFRRVGVPADRIEILGNLKHDREPSEAARRPEELRRRLVGASGDAGGEVLLVGGCTHPGEETDLCAIVQRLREAHPELRLVLAPRHVERLRGGEIGRWRSEVPLRLWSDLRDLPPDESAARLDGADLVVDVVGELEAFYAAADIAFVGGSLVPHGGHNMLEATRLGRPVLFGPHVENFRTEANHLLEAEAAWRVPDAAGLEEALRRLISSRPEREALGERAREASRRLSGAIRRHGDWIESHLRLFLSSRSC